MMHKKWLPILLIASSFSCTKENMEKARHLDIKNMSDYPLQAIIEQGKCRTQKRYALKSGHERYLPVVKRCDPKTMIIKSPDRPYIQFSYSAEHITGGDGEIQLKLKNEKGEPLYWNIRFDGRKPVTVTAESYSFEK